MKPSSFCILYLLFLFVSCQPSPTHYELIISNVHVIDIQTGDILRQQDVLIGKGIIQKIRPHREEIDTTMKVIQGKDKYLIPGLWDMHVHVMQDADYRFALPMTIANGITSIRDMGGETSLRDSLYKKGEYLDWPLPRIWLAGGILGGNPARNGVSVATPEEGEE